MLTWWCYNMTFYIFVCIKPKNINIKKYIFFVDSFIYTNSNESSFQKFQEFFKNLFFQIQVSEFLGLINGFQFQLSPTIMK